MTAQNTQDPNGSKVEAELDRILDNFMQGLVVSDATGYKVPGTIFQYLAPAQNSIEAKAKLNTLIQKAVEDTHALYPDKEEYYAKPMVKKLVARARLEGAIKELERNRGQALLGDGKSGIVMPFEQVEARLSELKEEQDK